VTEDWPEGNRENPTIAIGDGLHSSDWSAPTGCGGGSIGVLGRKDEDHERSVRGISTTWVKDVRATSEVGLRV
jgi:hypothetical protein